MVQSRHSQVVELAEPKAAHWDSLQSLLSDLQYFHHELAPRFSQIAAVYLFGSQVEGEAHPGSDIDLAVLGRSSGPLSFLTVARYQAEISQRLKTDRVDVVDLRAASPAIQFAVINRGALIYCCDPDGLARLQEQVQRAHTDLRPYRQMSYTLYRSFLKQRYSSHGGKPMLDVDRITDKINYIRQTCLPVLTDLSRMPLDEFLTDVVAIGAARYYLQTAIEAMLDINVHILSQQGLGTFETHAQTIEALAEAEVVSRDNLSTYVQMVGLRNRMVHVYEQIDNGIIHRILTDRLSDFEKYIADIVAFLDRLDQSGNP
jgi:uncharacterized protein YutE (UPF0331/DUF86 family)/predicted nucleotidyltransferase